MSNPTELAIGAMIFIAVMWLGLGLLFAGIGLLARRAFGLSLRRADDGFAAFWLGWTGVLALLQIWSLFLPVDWRAFVPIAALGVTGLIWNRKDILSFVRTRLRRQNGLLALVLLAALLWLSNQAGGSPRGYDAGLYHVPTMRWAETYPAVPGLGNLHGRLAFNSAHFLYQAMLDAGLWDGRAQHLGNGLLLFVLLADTLLSLRRVIRRTAPPPASDTFRTLIGFAVLGPAILANVSSPSMDLPVFVLTLVTSGRFLVFLENSGPQEETDFSAYLLIALALAGTTLKLSFLAYGGTLGLLALAAWLYRVRAGRLPGPVRPFLAVAAVTGIVFIVPWTARSIVLSGYVAYPLAVGALPVEWRVPIEAVRNEADWILAWARQPHTDPAEVLSGWAWLKPWLARTLLNYELDIVLSLTAVSLALVAFGRLRRKGRARPGDPRWWVLCPPILSLIYWFFSAPDYRFASGSFVALGAGIFAIALHRTGRPGSRRDTGIVLALLALFLLPAIAGNRYLWIEPGEDYGLHPIPTVDLETFTTDSGLVLYTPVQDDDCWAAPLPCTPYPNARLALLNPDRLQDGFTVTGGE